MNTPKSNDSIADIMGHIMDLQARIAFQEDTIQALNDTVVEQEKMISILQLKLQRSESRLDDLSYSIESSGTAANEKPPHY